MKKSIYAFIIILFVPLISFGQGIYDALRYSQSYYEGTARSIAMGNAFVALGGDLGALSINPAASGVYRYSEFVITPSLTLSLDKTNYLGNVNKENRLKLGLPNVAWISSFSTGRKSGLLNFNIAIAANQRNNYTSRTGAYGSEANSSWLASMAANMPTYVTGFSMDMPDGDPNRPFYNSDATWREILAWNTVLLDTLKYDNNFIAATENIGKDGYYYIGGPLNQNFFRETSGYVSDITINFGGNISDKLFFGVNLTMQSIFYNHYEIYSETASDYNAFETGFKSFTHNYTQTTSGMGLNLKAGIIYLPFSGLRLGASVSTPTWMFLKDQWEESIKADFNDANYTVSSPLGVYNYRVKSPFRWSVGAAYTIGKVAILSADYENVNYSGIVMSDSYGNKSSFQDENSGIASTFKSSNIFRAGAEVRATPSFSIRAGYTYYGSAEKNFKGEVQYGSFGLGYRAVSGFSIDLAYQHQLNKTTETYSLYQPYQNIAVPLMDDTYSKIKLFLTLGFRF